MVMMIKLMLMIIITTGDNNENGYRKKTKMQKYELQH